MTDSEQIANATLNALKTQIAILDETGTIISVNNAWRQFAKNNSANAVDLNVYEGASYLRVCESANGLNSEEAPAIAAGIRAVLNGQQKEFSLEYPCHSPTEKRWFIARVTKFFHNDQINLVVAHENITGRKLAEEKIENLLHSKETLIREVHHRVKNNINTMASLLTLQASEITDRPTVNLFKDAIGRLKSMATLYNRLYTTENYTITSVQAYLNQLVDDVQNLFIGYPVVIEKDMTNFDLSPKQLSSLGIIVNELITNGIKHAFPNGNNGKIKISIARKNEKAILIYQDNGVGFRVDTKHIDSFGLKLIDLLTRELKGNLEVKNREGTVITIEFPVNI